MRIRAQWDTQTLGRGLKKREKRIAFGTAQALNETGKKIQTAWRVQMDRKLTVRQAGFMYRLIKILAFASARKNQPFTEIGIDPTKKRILLGKLERGGVKKPEVGKTVAVPLTGEAARPSFQKPVPLNLHIGRLRFRQHQTRTGKTQWKGAKRTFILPRLGIFQRGAGKASGRKRRRGFRGLAETTTVRMIYSFEKRPELKKILQFVNVALKTFREHWNNELRKALRKPN